MKNKGLLVVLMSAALAVPVLAQPEASDGAERGVARISVINGDVSMRRGDTGDVSAAAINAPLLAQDRLMTGSSSHAEIQFDWANMLRVGPMSEVRLSELDNQRYQIQVAAGTVTFRVLRDSNADVEISSPNISVRPSRKGTYRITVREDGTTEATVRSGEAEVFSPRGSEILKSGRTMLARGTASDPEFQMTSAIPTDEWDRWNERRDHDLEHSRSYQYVSRDVYGADDLDSYGTWAYDDPYGWVWRPRVAVGWAPYRLGRWVWADWYGWTWVSYDPWGWAPYHYGRWYYGSGGWCWWPGGIGVRHYWSPALVGFFGFGGGGIGVGFGSIGWVPLGPHEPLHRWWGPGFYHGGYGRGSFNSFNNVVVNNVNITNVYRNARVSNGVTGVNSNDFVRGGARYGGVSDAQIRGASVVQGQLPVAPSRQNLRMADREVRTGVMPRTRDDAHFYSQRNQAAAPGRTAFGQPSQGVQAGSRAASNPVAQTTDRQNGWRRFGEPATRTNVQPGRAVEAPRAASPAPARGESGGGWRRFGEPQGSAARQSEAPAVRPSYGKSQSFGRPVPEQSAPRTVDRGYRPETTQRYSAPSRSSEPIRVSPPIVQQRSAPVERGYRPDSAPRYSAPSRSSEPSRVSPPAAPQRSAPQYSAPSRSSGGGGGSAPSRSEGRGGSSHGGGRSR